MIAALLALALQAPPPEPTVPELWAEVVAMRAERDRQYVRIGIETPTKEAIRHDLEDEVARLIRPARLYRLGPGRAILRTNRGRYDDLEEIEVPEPEAD